MEIEVRLFATYQTYLPKGEGRHTFKLGINEGARVADVLKQLKMPEEMPKILLVNGRHAQTDTTLEPGDAVSIFPPLGGG